MKSINNYIQEALIKKTTKLKKIIDFDEFINIMKKSKNNNFTYISSIKNLDTIQLHYWYKWDILKNTYVYVIKKLRNFYKVIVIQENENNPGSINIIISNIDENIKNDNTLYYFDSFFENSSVSIIIKNIEWIDEFLNLLEILVKYPQRYNDEPRWSEDFSKFEKNFLTDEYLIFK